jgi:hypothetical protein
VKIKIYSAIMLPVGLPEIGSVTLRQEHKFCASENGMPGIIFGRAGDEMKRSRKRMNFDEVHNFLSSPGIVIGVS